MNQNCFKLNFALLFFILIIQTICLADIPVKISGKVTDAKTGNGLDDVMVYITDKNSGVTDSTPTNASGEWEYDLAVGIEKEWPSITKPLSSSQNYPNPFTRSTFFNFTLASTQKILLKVTNILGKTIDSFAGNLTPGKYRFRLLGKASPDIYFVTLQTPNSTITRKIIQLGGGDGQGRIDLQAIGNSVDHRTVATKVESIPITLTLSKYGYAKHTENVDVSGGEHFPMALVTIHDYCYFTDMHNDILCKMASNPNYRLGDLHTTNHTDIPRLQKGGVDIQLFAIFVSPSASNNFNKAMAQADIFKDEMLANTATIAPARTESEALSIINEGKIAGVLVAEGGNVIQNSLDNLRALYQAGVRYLTITHNKSLDWAICASDNQSSTKGLTEFGKQVIRTMDSLGMIIDVAHTGIKTIEDILATTKNPIIDSHCGAKALRNHYRNLSDSQIKAIAKTGGLIGIVFLPSYLVSSGSADVDDVVDHIEYIANLVGVDHVGVGSDFDGTSSLPKGLKDVSYFPNLTEGLLKRGFSQEDIEKITGRNFLRVFKQVCGK